VALAVADDLGVEEGRQGVDDRDADAVEAAGDGVGLAAELAARVELGHDDLERGPVLDRMLVDGDAAAVVGDADATVAQDGDLDAVAVAGERLLDGVWGGFLEQAW